MCGRLLKTAVVIFLLVGLLVSGCVAEKTEDRTKTPSPTVTQAPVTQPPASLIITLEVQPVIDYYSLGGLSGNGEEAFYILSGDTSAVKKSLEALVIDRVSPPAVFTEDEILNLVVFRGVFSTGGHGIGVDTVEKAGNIFTVYATYTDPGAGMMVTEAFTQPMAIIPLGKLLSGDYEAKLMVTSIVKEEGGDKIIEENKEYASVTFTVS